MFKFVELCQTRREVLSIQMQLGAFVVTSRRTFDIFDGQAYKLNRNLDFGPSP